MKRIKNLLYILMVGAVITASLSGCKKKEDDDVKPDPVAEQRDRLMNNGKSWSGEQGTVLHDGNDVSDDYRQFLLKFQASAFTTQGAPAEVWPASSSWQFVNGDINKIERSDGIVMDISFPAQNQLQVKFTLPEESTTNSRVMGIAGEYNFLLVSE